MSRSWTLVTGASGFIGARLVRHLVEQGQRVRALVRAGSSLSQLEGLPQERFQLALGDIQVEHTVFRAMAGCDRVFHVASEYRIWALNEHEISDPAIMGTRAVLSAARKRGVQRVVVTSSAVALGANDAAQPVDERHAFNLAGPYPRAKRAAQDLALELAEAWGLSVVVVQPSAVVGPGDWKPTPTGESIVQYLRQGAYWRFPVPGGGINVVDVDDVVEGHALAMDRGTDGECYILGGENLTHEQFLKILSELTGLYPPANRQSKSTLLSAAWFLELWARASGEPPPVTVAAIQDYVDRYLWVTSRKAEEELGYGHRPARETLARAVRWYVTHGYVPRAAARRIRPELRLT